MIECPKCHHRFPESTSSREAFELFHALRDEYAEAQRMNKVEAKDVLCVMFGVSMELDIDESGKIVLLKAPKWPGVFCTFLGRPFFRKSTLAYTKDEMTALINRTQEAITVREE